MNFAHLRAILWMRWRMLVNLVKRRGKLGNTLFTVLVVFLLLIACGGLFLSFALGMELLPEAEPVGILLVWCGLTAALTFFWSIGVVTELQRSDAITIQSLLHLPASMLGAHTYNYLASFVSVSLMVVLPVMIGLASSSVVVLGPKMLLLFPLIVGYVGLLTALTYQLRGWLATMIHDKRKQRNVIVLLTISFALFAQVPNLAQIAFNDDDDDFQATEVPGEVEELTAPTLVEADSDPAAAADSGETVAMEIDATEPPPVAEVSSEDAQADPAAVLQPEVAERMAEQKARKKAQLLLVDKWVTRVAAVVPIGWLGLGAKLAFQGNVFLSLLCFAGLAAITAFSLRRSYQTTLRFVTGIDDREKGGEVAAPVKQKVARESSRARLVGKSLPFVGEATSSVAVAAAQSLLRSAEFKMVMLTPLLLLVFGGAGLLANDGVTISEVARPYLSLAAICMGLFTVMQLLQNQFGLDRHGFRAFVLSPISRQHLLQGKNLACAPVGLVLSAVGIVTLQIIHPESLLHFLSIWFLLAAGYLITSLYSNFISIVAPMKLKDGMMKADSAQGKVILVQVLTLLLLPLCLCPIALPASLEGALDFFNVGVPVPVYLPTSILVFLGSVAAYRLILPWQAALLQEREQTILDRLTRAVF